MSGRNGRYGKKGILDVNRIIREVPDVRKEAGAARFFCVYFSRPIRIGPFFISDTG